MLRVGLRMRTPQGDDWLANRSACYMQVFGCGRIEIQLGGAPNTGGTGISTA
jgi:hypothetical protein|eukprot:SAG25_NODE_1923_length_2143_cov_10.595004_2_plen_52_part_00